MVSKRKRSTVTKVNALAKRLRVLEKDTKDLRFHNIPIDKGSFSYGTACKIYDVLAGITPGPDENGMFQGSALQTKVLQARFTLEGGSVEHDTIRIVVWVEKEGSTLPTVMTPLQYRSTGVAPYSPWSRESRGEFKVLYNKTMVLTNAGFDPAAGTGSTQVVTGATPHYKFFNLNIKVPKKYQECNWDPVAGTFKTNRLYIGMVSDSAVAPHPGPPDNNGMAILYYDS